MEAMATAAERALGILAESCAVSTTIQAVLLRNQAGATYGRSLSRHRTRPYRRQKGACAHARAQHAYDTYSY